MKKLYIQGFTLIEILVAMTIFSIGILGVATLQLLSVKSNTSASVITSNAMIGESQVEMLMGFDYADAALSTGTHVPDQDRDGVDNNSDGQIDEPGERGAIVVSYVVETDAPIRGMKTVTHTTTHSYAFGEKSISFVKVIPDIR